MPQNPGGLMIFVGLSDLSWTALLLYSIFVGCIYTGLHKSTCSLGLQEESGFKALQSGCKPTGFLLRLVLEGFFEMRVGPRGEASSFFLLGSLAPLPACRRIALEVRELLFSPSAEVGRCSQNVQKQYRILSVLMELHSRQLAFTVRSD